MTFPRAAFKAALLDIGPFSPKSVVWDVEPEPPRGPKGSEFIRGICELSILSEVPEGDGDEFRREYNEDSELIEVEHVNRTITTVQIKVTCYAGVKAENVLATVRKKLRWDATLEALRAVGLALVHRENVKPIPTVSDNQETSCAVLDVVLRRAVDNDLAEPENNVAWTETWIETVEVSEDEDE